MTVAEQVAIIQRKLLEYRAACEDPTTPVVSTIFSRVDQPIWEDKDHGTDTAK